jgi:hypothetical protein
VTAVRSLESEGDGAARYVIRSAPVHRASSLMEEEADLSAHNEYLCSSHWWKAERQRRSDTRRRTAWTRLPETSRAALDI